MGQLLLGFRSLLVKLAVFVLMAALLAWALGGTLWPRAVVAEHESVTIGETTWAWKFTVGGERRDRPVAPPRWTMIVRRDGGGATAFPNPESPITFREVASPLVVDDRVVFAGVENTDVTDSGDANVSRTSNPAWTLFIAARDGSYETYMLPDRLAVEQQLERLRAGLPVQDAQTIVEQRSRVLDPGEE
jgi:hypothetical protein